MQAELIEKGWNECHKAVYGRAEKRIAVGEPEENILAGRVRHISLKLVGPQRNIDFTNSRFIIKHTGTYIIELFSSLLIRSVLLVPIIPYLLG